MHRASGGDAPGIEFDFPEGVLVACDVLLQHAQQCFGLLWAEVDSLEVLDFDLRLALLQKRSKHEKEVPDIHPDLYAVGVVFTIFSSIHQLDGRLDGIRHKDVSVAEQPPPKEALPESACGAHSNS